jgi:hypothetical protein
MAFALYQSCHTRKKIVLHGPHGYSSRLDAMVEDIFGDGSRDYDLLTSSHPGETADDFWDFVDPL